MSSKIQARTLKGFRDFLPEEMIPRTAMLSTVEAVFRRYGYVPIKTPALEYQEVLMGKYGEEGDKLLYHFTDHGGRKVALRYDLTVPLARVVAQHHDLERPLRRYQIDTVWRAEKPGRGRFREFSQCDVDLIGSQSMVADAECIIIADALLRALGVNNFVIRVNNRKLLNGLLANHGVVQKDQVDCSLRLIDKLEKIGVQRVVELLVDEQAWELEAAQTLLDTLSASQPHLERLAQEPTTSEGAKELMEVLELVRASGVPVTQDGSGVRVDLSVARGLDYYTGTVYETSLTDLAGFGSVMSGGRYDTLLEMFTGKPLPAVGISLGVDRLFAGLCELGLVTRTRSVAKVLVAQFPGVGPVPAMQLASRLREEGLEVEVYPDAHKLEKQYKYADKKQIPIVALMGPDEQVQGTVRLKALATREQATVSIDEAMERIREMLSQA